MTQLSLYMFGVLCYFTFLYLTGLIFAQYIPRYEGKSISKLQIVIEKKQMGIMTYKQHLFFNVISKQI